MKRTLIITCSAALLAVTVLAASVVSGYGKRLTATTTPVKLNSVGSTKFCDITVLGSEIVYVMKNTATNDFVQTDAIPVSTGYPKTLWTGDDIDSITYATSNGTSEVLIFFQ